LIIDAHHHVWDPAIRPQAWLAGHPALRRRFDLGDFWRAAAPHGVTAAVLVQVLASTAETEEFLARAANPAGGVAGVVGWVDLCAPNVGGEIARLRRLPGGDRLVGIRHLVQDEPDPAWLDRAEVRRGLRAVAASGLAYDLLVRPAQLPAALRVTGDLDGLVFVLDHAAKPPVATGEVQPWATLIAELGTRSNLACKLSGLVTEAAARWQPGQFARYADVLLDSFGPDRLMFGSDWPVCTLAATYGQVLCLARDLLSPRLSPAEREAVFAGTARSIYGLAPAD
jgi:L-fuconolactonase